MNPSEAKKAGRKGELPRNDSVFFIKFGLVSVHTEQQTFRPGRRPFHLFAHSLKRHPHARLNNQFIMDMGDNAAAPRPKGLGRA